jgi:AraC family transcriptional regulator
MIHGPFGRVPLLRLDTMESSINRVSRADIPLAEIAQNLGFDLPGNFIRFFGCEQGVTPSRYRRMIEFVPGASA